MKRLTKQSSVTLIELLPTQYGILNGKPSFHEFSKSRMPLRAVHALEGSLRHDGWENVRTISSQYHGKNGKLTSENFKRIFNSDVLLASYLTSTFFQTMSLINLYKQNNPNGIAVAGGFDATFRTEEALKNSDIVVRGEGEKTLIELMNRLITKDYGTLKDIDGLAFKKGKEIIITNSRKLMSSEELSLLPHPYYDEETKREVLGAAIETSRGCPNDCDFCTVTEFYGGRYRTKSIEYVIEELKRTKDLGKYIFYTDDNLIGSPNKTINLLEKIADEGLNKKLGLAQTTIKLADNPELMKSMKKAGITLLCIGLESINDESLQDLGKPYRVQNKIKEQLKHLENMDSGLMG
ncbi:MAG: radical SAM protein [Nanoarchaeota archaeon]